MIETNDTAPTWSADDLAREVGTMTTTVRMYQNKGLLHPPRKSGRKAIYDQTHVDRLRLIGDLQARGHSLAGIADLIAAHDQGAPLSQLLGLKAWHEPDPLTISIIELAQRLGNAAVDPDVLRRAVESGLVTFSPDGTSVTVADRRFVDFGSALIELGVSSPVVLDEWEALAATMHVVAERFVTVFERDLLPGLGEASLAEIAGVLDRLVELAREVTVSALDGALRLAAQTHLEQLGVSEASHEGSDPSRHASRGV